MNIPLLFFCIFESIVFRNMLFMCINGKLMILIYYIMNIPLLYLYNSNHSKFGFSGNGLNGCELKSRHHTGKKIFGEMEKLLVTSNFSFSQNVFFAFWYIFSSLHILHMSFATCFNLDKFNY